MNKAANRIKKAHAYNKMMKTRRMLMDPDAIEDREEDLGIKNRLNKPPSVKQDPYEKLEEGKKPFKAMDRELMPSQKKAKKKYLSLIFDEEDIGSDDGDKGIVGESQKAEKYICDICGARVRVIKGGAGTLVCCDEPMRKFANANSVEDYYEELMKQEDEQKSKRRNKKKGGKDDFDKYYRKLIRQSKGSSNPEDLLHDFMMNHRKVRERLYDPVASLLIEKEIWDRSRATLYILRMVNEAAKLYSKEYGGNWDELFPTKSRKVLTDRIVRDIETKRGGGEDE